MGCIFKKFAYKIVFWDVFWGGAPWDPMGGAHGIPWGVHGIPGWALGDPLALGDPGPWGPIGPWGPLGLGDPGPWGPLGPQDHQGTLTRSTLDLITRFDCNVTGLSNPHQALANFFEGHVSNTATCLSYVHVFYVFFRISLI